MFAAGEPADVFSGSGPIFSFSGSPSRDVFSDCGYDSHLYNRIMMSRIESARCDGMAGHLVRFYQVGVSDVAILPDP